MHVIFVEPGFPNNQREFVRGLAEAGAHVTGIGERPIESLGSDLRRWLSAYERVPTVVDVDTLHATVKRIQERGWVDRLESTVEAHVMPAAQVREATNIPGTTTRTAYLCRDKPAMKQALREAGVACAQSRGATAAEEAREFAAKVGYPIILKPHAAAGAAGTHRAADDTELERAIQLTGLDRGQGVALEEFIEGHEGFYDTITCEGKVVHDFGSHYYPNVLEAMRTRWISPQIVCTNRIDDKTYDEVRQLGKKVIDVLGIRTSATHMEWFFGPKGLKFSEIGCRPPGVGVWDLYAAGNEIDIYREWAQLVCWGETATRTSRRFATGMIALRPDKDGQVTGIEGFEKFCAQHGESLLDYHIPRPGTPTQGVEGGYMANAWLRFKHPDYDGLRQIMDAAGETVKLRAE